MTPWTTVFALSIEEAEAYFPDRDDNLWAEATPYAAEQGAYVADNGFSPWWLRSPGDHNEGGFCAAYVDYPPVGVSIGGYAPRETAGWCALPCGSRPRPAPGMEPARMPPPGIQPPLPGAQPSPICPGQPSAQRTVCFA